jgi:hypothetical protein
VSIANRNNYVQLKGFAKPQLVDIDDLEGLEEAGMIEYYVDPETGKPEGEGGSDGDETSGEQQSAEEADSHQPEEQGSVYSAG